MVLGLEMIAAAFPMRSAANVNQQVRRMEAGAANAHAVV